MSEAEQKPTSHEDYRIPGTDGFSFSKWARENLPQKDHKFKVGDVVTITVTMEVTALTRDCDGTPLYNLHNLGGGWSEDDMRLATDDERDDY